MGKYSSVELLKEAVSASSCTTVCDDTLAVASIYCSYTTFCSDTGIVEVAGLSGEYVESEEWAVYYVRTGRMFSYTSTDEAPYDVAVETSVSTGYATSDV